MTAPAAPLRFCLLTTFYPPWHFGGDAIQVERLAHALGDAGHQVTVVHTPLAHRLLRGQLEHAPRIHPRVEVVALAETAPSLARTYLTGRPQRARPQIEEVLARGYDVIHFHNPALLGAPAVLGMGDAVKLYTAHEQWLLCPGHTLLRARGQVCDRPPCWNCELVHRRPPQPWRRTGLLERSLEHLDALIVPSHAQAELHRRFTPALRIEVIDHFVPPAAPRDPEAAPERPYFLYAGRLERIKGVATLLDAFARSAPAELVIAGDGGRARSLRRRARGIPGVRFKGWVDQDRLDRLYRDALAVVVPSIGHESFGLVTAEAFARGTPAIVNSLGALGDLARDSGAALAYSTPEQLDGALARMAGEPALRARMGERALAAYAERFTVERHMSRYMALIEELAA